MSATELQKFGIKVFAKDGAAIELDAFIPVFHRWIREHRVPGILVDVADYGHLPKGPGVVLVGHEADFYMDSMEGQLGLLYSRKLPQPGPFADRLRASLQAAREACAALEAEPELEGRLTFDAADLLFLSNDRLVAPNTEEAFAALRPDLEAVFGGSGVRREAGDPRRRLAARLKAARG